ncbi:MAG: enoyl-CoA hydratase/isomerase family protein [Halioglobus sp.]|nr:enoyl-CoA hydratase/isomerase family protein [Halioglobus sp.]
MGKYNTVLIEQHGPVAVVSLNRPDKLNSFDGELRRELLQAVREVNADDSVRAVVLTGAGRAFSAGADLGDMPEDKTHFRVEDQLNGEYKPVLMEIHEAHKPWISAVNGACAGIGSAFAMVCDLTVMADDAYLYQAFAAISLVPDGGATWHLVRTLGRKRAYEVIVTGEKLRADKCLQWGLCNRVAAADTLIPETLAWATEIAGKAPLSLRYAKEAVNAAVEDSVSETISKEAKLQHICITSEDAQEGVIAFMQKRPPVWKGR